MRVAHASGDTKKKGLGSRLKAQGLELGMKLMNDPKNQQRVLRAIDTVQRTKSELGRLAEQALHAYNLPSQKDLKAIGKKVNALRKEALEIKQRLEELK